MKSTYFKTLFFAFQTALLCDACTNVLVTPKASVDKSSIIAYNADSGNLFGMLYHYPISQNEPGSPRKVWNWDTGVYLGEIEEARNTYNVVGNTNEHGLVIAETTFGGIDVLANPKHQPNAKIDYGSLIYITLQRSKTAKEAILTMKKLMDKYGYASEGESFSIADRFGDVWIMEVIGRGEGKVGSVWVAVKIPDGMISAHSNQARIRTFPRDDEENCMYSHDVVELAKEIGVYKSAENDPHDLLFSFSDTYDPISFTGARFSDARTYSIFSVLAKDSSFGEKFESYAMGKDPTNRMPLWIEPKKKLTYDDIQNVMANHYEGTALEFGDDVGAGPYNSPYRARPLVWKYKDVSYHNERAVATQQTGWNFIAQIRLDMPPQISTILWFAVDDSSTSPRVPVYGCSTAVSDAYSGKGTQDGVPSPLLTFDVNKAFWVQNMVSNLAYSRWKDSYPLITKRISAIHDSFYEEIKYLDKALLAQYDHKNEEAMVQLATEFSIQSGDRLHKEWFDFYGELFARLRDFYVVEEDKNDPICNCKVKESGFSQDWARRIVEETSDKYQCIDKKSVPDLASILLRGTEVHNKDIRFGDEKLNLKALK